LSAFIKMAITSAKENKTLIAPLYLLFYKTISVSSTRLRLSFKEESITMIC
jgi:hypothetical protein